MTDRQAVVENAKYLREVRPIDPEEIHEYVPEQPHPAVVRQVLREEAVRLALRERDDGTFVPVEDGPLETGFSGVDSVPEHYARRLEDVLVETYGAGWPEGESGDELRSAIHRLKDAYYRQRDVEYDRTAALGYAIYHLPGYYAAIQYVVGRLLRAELFDRTLRVLDVGAGVGGPALGLADLLGGDAVVDYHGVEPSAAADVLESLLEETGHNFHTTVHRTTAEAFQPEGTYDLVLFANVLSELDDPDDVLTSYFDVVADDGSLVALAPADRNTSTALRRRERALADAGPATVYSPTVRLWPHVTPSDRCWSFDRQPDLAEPSFQRTLQEAGREDDDAFYNLDVQYSWFVGRHDEQRAVAFRPDRSRFARMRDMDQHVTDRIDLAAIKLSHSLSDESDANPLYLIGDGSQQVDHYAVHTNRTALNEDLPRAAYGDLLLFEAVLVLFNDDENAYNLVVDQETVVDRVPAAGSPEPDR
jgi:SAM-dependent methyltransferase